MIGKKIGVQATNEAVWNAFLKANNIDPSKINKVVVQFDPQPLVAKEVDGWFSFVTNEPNLLKAKGVDTVTFLLADYKYPLVSETYVVKKRTLTEQARQDQGDAPGRHQGLAGEHQGPDARRQARRPRSTARTRSSPRPSRRSSRRRRTS